MAAGASSTIAHSARRRGVQGKGAALPIVPAELSDHVGIYCFLNSVFDGPSQAEFRASLEDPCYRPSDRLVAKEGDRVVAHVQVLRRSVRLSTLWLPAAQLDWLAAAPKLQEHGFETRLLRSAESNLVRSGALVGWVRTRSPESYRQLGWVDCGPPRLSCGDAHRVLRALMEKGFRLPGRRTKFHIRPWLLWEVGSLPCLYREAMGEVLGPFERTEAYWQWLVRRHAFDQLYVAIEGPDLIDMDEGKARVVGYAATKGMQILELATAVANKEITAMLLARVCHDAIELGRHSVLLHAPDAEPLHKVFQRAGGHCECIPSDSDEVLMARVPRPLALLRMMQGVLFERAVAANLPPKLDLGFRVGKKQYMISLTESQLTILGHKLPQHSVELNGADFALMVLGRLDWERGLAEQRITARNSEAEYFARALFPTIPFWKPPLDDLKRDGVNPY